MTGRNDAPQGVRCDTCGGYFSTEAIMKDHARLHEADPAERERILDEQNERKP